MSLKNNRKSQHLLAGGRQDDQDSCDMLYSIMGGYPRRVECMFINRCGMLGHEVSSMIDVCCRISTATMLYLSTPQRLQSSNVRTKIQDCKAFIPVSPSLGNFCERVAKKIWRARCAARARFQAQV